MGEVGGAFHDNDGARTKALYDKLFAIGPAGGIAVNLLRIAKNSRGGKKKTYSGRGRRSAYDSKDWAIGELCRALVSHADALGIVWGWGYDAKAIAYEHVLYVELPDHGQVSFHTHSRREGPDYAGQWDGVKDVCAARVIGWAQFIFNGERHVGEKDRRQGSTSSSPEVPPLRGAGPGSEAPCGECHLSPGERCDICGKQEAFDL